MMRSDDIILQTIAKLMVPFIQVYGAYIILNGHLSPGGGFAGGTLIGSSLILYALSYDVQRGMERYPRQYAKFLESMGGISFITIGLFSMVRGGTFLSNNLFSSLGTTGTLFSGGTIVLISLAIGVKVASTVVTLFYHLFEEKKI